MNIKLIFEVKLFIQFLKVRKYLEILKVLEVSPSTWKLLFNNFPDHKVKLLQQQKYESFNVLKILNFPSFLDFVCLFLLIGKFLPNLRFYLDSSILVSAQLRRIFNWILLKSCFCCFSLKSIMF